MIKLKAWEDSREIIISIDDVVNLGQTRRRKIVEVADIVNNTITLDFVPLTLSETVVMNGTTLTAGLDYDYTISGVDVIFNSGVIGSRGHILINYYSL